MIPDTSAAFHLAYVVAAAIYGGYSLTLWRRARRLRERLDALTRERGL